jgi:glycosyltransferase involved in cell wall biosynthesis
MNILALTSSYPRFEGDPTAPFVESIVRHVAARGHTIHVVLPATRGWDRPPSEGSVHYHPYRYSPIRSWTPWGYSQSLEGGVKLRRSLYALAPIVAASALRTSRSLLSRNRFDVVHVHWAAPNGPIGALAARGSGIPLVVTLHGSDMAVSERSRLIGRATRWALERATAVTAPSGDLLERARRLGATGLLECVPYGADVIDGVPLPDVSTTRARLGVRPDDLLVAAVGRLIPVKGFDYLLDGFAEAQPAGPPLRLVVVGDGSERRRLEDRATELGVRDGVTFTGMVGPEEVPTYLAAADIVVVPSVRHEGFVDGLPNVALEAMAAGRALVATRVGGLPELVRNDETGLLVDEKDVGQLADAITRLARDAALRARLGDAARLEIQTERSWESVAERFEAVYERASAGT